MDRADVVRAWECCIDTENGPCAEECPMKDAEWKETGLAACRAFADDHVEVPLALVQRTLELLKAQEPRVITLEDAQGADYCWYESRAANICILCDATMYPNLKGRPETELQMMGTSVRGWLYDDAYGKDWRCWNREPTKEQREATPWE